MNQIKVELQDTFGNDKAIANAAWTSSLDYEKKKSRTDEDVKRVVEMLAVNRHATPFESVVFRFWIKMPIAIDRQFMTHRIQSANGMSGRYRTMPTEYFDIPDDVTDIMLKLTQNINHITLNDGTIIYGDYDNILEAYYYACETSNHIYKFFTTLVKQDFDKGIINNNEYKRVREFMRGVLPQHNMTERVSIMNLRSFSNFQKLRNSEHAQPEIKKVAELMLESVKKSNTCPIAIEWLEKNNWQL